MSTASRSRLQTDERRAQLLELGLELFGTRAYDEVAIEDIAAAAGVSKGLLYHYFGGKRDFYVATVRYAAQQLLAAIEAADEQPTPQARAVAGIDAYLRFVAEHASVYVAFHSGGLGADPEVARIMEDTRSAIVQDMVEDLGVDVGAGLLRLSLRAWIGGVEAAAIQWLDAPNIERSQLVALLAGTLRETIMRAAALDPDVGTIEFG